MTDHACNLRCSYCYTGAKAARPMPEALGRQAIARAVRSLRDGGELELGFFGGEPLLGADLVGRLADDARRRTAERGQGLQLGLTTNGTVDTAAAWSILRDPSFEVTVSLDGPPDVHDRHRVTPDGRGTSGAVLRTIDALVASGRAFRVLMVVRPDTVATLPAGVAFLRSRGVRAVDPSLDLWARWTADDVARLEEAVARLADVWREGLPHHGVSWFDEKLLSVSALPSDPGARCGFGVGQIAVAPSGRLYPCERLIGEDRPPFAMSLPGHVAEGDDFLSASPLDAHGADASRSCAIQSSCATDCRCSNYVRTGDPRRPDGLLCRLDRAITAEIARTVAPSRPKESLHA